MVGLNSHLQNWSLMCLLLAYHASTWWVRVCIKKNKFILYMCEVLWSPCSVLYLLRILLSVYIPGWRWHFYFYSVYGYLYHLMDDSWCCRNYCWFAFALWCGYCLVSFQSFAVDHLVITTVQKPKKLPPISWSRYLPSKGRIFVFTNACRSESSSLLKTNIHELCFGSILSLD